MTIRVTAAVGLALAAVGPGAAAEPADGVRIGLIQGMFRDVQPAMIQAMSRPLRDMIHRQTGLTGDVELVPDPFTLADRMTAKKCHLGVFHGFEFAWVRKAHPDLVPLAVSVPHGRKLQAYVVVPNDSPAKCLADLKQEAVLVPRGIRAHCLAFLDKVKSELPDGAKGPKATTATTPEAALDAVLAGESPAALIDGSALTGYQSLKPGAFKQLRVLCQSEVFPLTVVAYRRGTLTDDTVGRIRRLLTGASANAAGRPLLTLWNLKGFEDVPADYEAQLERCIKAYPPVEKPAIAVPTSTTGG